MTAANGFAQRLAGEISDELDMPAPNLNAHVNIVENAERRGKIKFIQGRARGIQVENDLDYPRIRPEHIKEERDPKRAIQAVLRNGLEGVIYGVDHAYRANIDPRHSLLENKEEFKRHLRTVHLSGSKTDHGLISDDDYEFWDFLDFISKNIEKDVVFCLDLNPKEMGTLSSDAQIDYLEGLISKLEKY
jgi:hypothetical protein